MIIEIDYLNKKQSNKLISTCSNLKHKCLMLIMLDCGTRISETITLKFSNFDFKQKTIRIRSLKKRGLQEVFRTIPLSDRLYTCLVEYVSQLGNFTADTYLFPGQETGSHITRTAANKFMERIKKKNPDLGELHPHALRHTFATHLVVDGTPLHDIKYLLGHSKLDTTTIYTHTPLELLKKRIDNLNTEQLSPWEKIRDYIYPRRAKSLINLTYDTNDFIIGRNAELTKIIDLVNKNCNVILIGSIGVGKSHILKQINPNKKVLKIDDCSDIKGTLVQMLLYLFKNDKQTLAELFYGAYDLTKLETLLQKDSIKNLCDTAIKATQKHEYIIIIDSVDRITPKSVKALEWLKDHFTILTSAREIPIDKQSFLWNFEIIKLKPLERTNSLELIHKLAYDLDVEDFELFRNHIFEQTNGNPRAIFEIIDRYRKESIITSDVVRSIRHIGSLREYDMTFMVVIFLSLLAITRYLSHEVGNDSLKFIGGAALMLLIVSRYFFGFAKRKFV